MGISTAVSIAVAGMKVTQHQTDVAASNIARASEPGYTRKRLVISNLESGQGTIGVRGTVQRELDTEVQRQLISATSITGYTSTAARFASRIDQLMGTPGDTSSLTSVIADFSSNLQSLETSPEDLTARRDAASSAQALASRLNQMSQDIQGMRTDAENAISDSVGRVNQLLSNIADFNSKIVAQKASGADVTNLEDGRDASVKELSGLMDVKTMQQSNGHMSVFTPSGVTLVEQAPAQLSFDAAGTLTPNTLWSVDPKQRSVGTIKLVGAGGAVDLIEAGAIRSGSLAANIEARDKTLVQAQNQLDALAASLAQAMSNRTVEGVPASSGAPQGFDIDVSGLKAGNVLQLGYLDKITGEQKTVSFVRVDSAASLPLDDGATTDPTDRVVGIDFSGGAASVAAQIQTALGGGFSASNPAGSTVRILDGGPAGSVTVNQLVASVTTGSVQNESLGMPMFTDGAVAGKLFTDSLDGAPQRRGFAARIALNVAITADPSLLVKYQTTPATAAGDPTRPHDLLDRLNSTQFQFGPETGLVPEGSALGGTIESFSQQVISHWGAVANDAKQAGDSQTVIQNNLESRMNDASAVNVDDELARLVQLQSAYAANARVMTVVKEMIDALLRS